MFQQKNLSPNHFAFIVSLLISSFVTIISIFFNLTIFQLLILFVSTCIISYFLIQYTLNKFIYRKIKIIYKLISNTKATQREEFYHQELLPPKTIEEVQKEVENWSVSYRNEIDRLENNEEFRKQFLMNLSHELKTPIFAIQGYIDTLLDGALDDEKVNHHFLKKASLSIDRLAALVSDLDEISKLESNNIPLNKQYFNINELTKEVFDELSQLALQKQMKLFIKQGSASNKLVFADKAKIKQVFVNLIENGIKYGKENGEVSAGFYDMGNKTIFIEITDNGIGIVEDNLPRIFERFYRTDRARSRESGGTGLGLAIVKHIIEAHDHKVTCRSAIDVGSSFGFTLDTK